MPKEDRWDELLAPGTSQYQINIKYDYLIEATSLYTDKKIMDKKLQRRPVKGERWVVDYDRYALLSSLGYVRLVKKLTKQKNVLKQNSCIY